MLHLATKTENDHILVQRAKEGDENAFRMLVNRHKEKVHNLIFLTTGNDNKVDDLGQEVFIKVYRNMKNFKQEALFTTWLYRITVNVCKDELRKQALRKVLQISDTVQNQIKITNNKDELPLSNLVHQALIKLPKKLRIPLILKDIEEFNYEEIAEIMQCELGTVKSRLFRAREAMHKQLEPHKEKLAL